MIDKKSFFQTLRDHVAAFWTFNVVGALSELIANPRLLLMILGTGSLLIAGVACWVVGLYPFAFLFLVAGTVLAMQVFG